MTDLTINYDIIINFSSHNTIKVKAIFKSFDFSNIVQGVGKTGISSHNQGFSQQRLEGEYTLLRYRIDNTTVEAGSFNYSGSVTSWTNIPSQNSTAINLLNYSDANDTAEMDVQITVPLDEPPGNLTSNLILTGYYTAYYP